MIIGGVCLIPFCLFEFKMRPILQPLVYGISSGWEGKAVRRLSALGFSLIAGSHLGFG